MVLPGLLLAPGTGCLCLASEARPYLGCDFRAEATCLRRMWRCERRGAQCAARGTRRYRPAVATEIWVARQKCILTALARSADRWFWRSSGFVRSMLLPGDGGAYHLRGRPHFQVASASPGLGFLPWPISSPGRGSLLSCARGIREM
jgi:hypothetical protein